MKIFISWSGGISKAVAEVLRKWLPNVIPAVETWMSAEDIKKGMRWPSEIASNLEKIQVGLFCLTQDNLEAPWILFEAGALSIPKSSKNSSVCTYLFGVDESEIEFPLGQFQSTKANDKKDTKKLIHTLNDALSKEQQLKKQKINKAFETWWPKLNKNLNSITRTVPVRTTSKAKQGIVEFYNCRQDFPLLEDELKKSNGLWCMVMTGSAARDMGFYKKFPVTKVILMRPNGDAIKLHGKWQRPQKSLSQENEELAKEIKSTGGKQVKVYFSDAVVANSMIIWNPESKNKGVAQVEISYAFANTDERPIFLVRQAQNPSLFINLKKQYERIMKDKQLTREFSFKTV